MSSVILALALPPRGGKAPELYDSAASRMGSVLLALLRHRVVERLPESYLIDPVTSHKTKPRGSDFRLGSIIRWLLYEPVKAKTSPPRGEVAASALS